MSFAGKMRPSRDQGSVLEIARAVLATDYIPLPSSLGVFDNDMVCLGFTFLIDFVVPYRRYPLFDRNGPFTPSIRFRFRICLTFMLDVVNSIFHVLRQCAFSQPRRHWRQHVQVSQEMWVAVWQIARQEKQSQTRPR